MLLNFLASNKEPDPSLPAEPTGSGTSTESGSEATATSAPSGGTLHIAIILPDFVGHLNAGATLGRALKEEGHRVTIVSPPNGLKHAERHNLEFIPALVTEHDNGDLADDRLKLGKEKGLDAGLRTAKIMEREVAAWLRDMPVLFEEHSFDGLMVDEILFREVTAVADMYNIPWGTVANAATLLHQVDSLTPPVTFPWRYNTSWMSRATNKMAWKLLLALTQGKRKAVHKYQKEHGQIPIPTHELHDVGCIQLAQQPWFLELPKDKASYPCHMYYTSPWHTPEGEDTADFPWDRLNGKPILYASLGTLQNGNLNVYYNLCEACVGLDVQLVLALGKRGATLDPPIVPDDAIIVDYSPQIQLLHRASYVVSHCGMNTALETIACGLPVVATPITNDQPGVAVRMERLGLAVLITSIFTASSKEIREYIEEIMTNPKYATQAKYWQGRLIDAPKMDETAKLVALALQRKRKLPRNDPEVERILGKKITVPESPQESTSVPKDSSS